MIISSPELDTIYDALYEAMEYRLNDNKATGDSELIAENNTAIAKYRNVFDLLNARQANARGRG